MIEFVVPAPTTMMLLSLQDDGWKFQLLHVCMQWPTITLYIILYLSSRAVLIFCYDPDAGTEIIFDMYTVFSGLYFKIIILQIVYRINVYQKRHNNNLCWESVNLKPLLSLDVSTAVCQCMYQYLDIPKQDTSLSDIFKAWVFFYRIVVSSS